ncbi:anti-sigma factor [Psychrobacillus sp. BM2]|uniref:anti-sigma factor n=1 Tax=Psychrobacillus sp. BM2 TaxID=3400421 RepID=UPI003B014C47
MMIWNEKKADEILAKHKNRFSLRLTFKIIRVLVVIFIIYVVYMISLSMLYYASSIGEKTEFYQELAVDWTNPGITVGISSSTSNEITPFLTQKIEFPLIKRIGKEDYVVSQLNLRKTFITSFSYLEIEKSNTYNNSSEGGFNFYLPYNPGTSSKLMGSETPDVWSKLEKIHEGNVAELAFSTDEYYSPSDVVQLLSLYDLDITWMPIYMGELKQYTEGSWGSGGDSISLGKPWGLSGARLANPDFNGGSLISILDSSTVETSEHAMLENMNMMLDKNKRLAETLLGTDYLQERYDYLTEEGFQAYGAVVTGPVKELLKLKELNEIHSVQLGEITYWNWEEE